MVRPLLVKAVARMVTAMEVNQKYGEKCNKPWHTAETCWEIHGKPAHLKKKFEGSNRAGRALQAGSDDSEQQSSPSESVPFTKDQLELLSKMFK